MAEVHEAKRKRAERRGQKRKLKGNKVLGDQTRVEKCPWRIDIGGVEDHTKERPCHSPRSDPFYTAKKKASQPVGS